MSREWLLDRCRKLLPAPAAYGDLLTGVLAFLALAVVWGIRLADEEHPYQLLLLSLVVFSPPSRFPVFVLWWITKTWGLGTHYDIFDSWGQALVGQLFYGSLLQIIPGFLLGSLTLSIKRSRGRTLAGTRDNEPE